MDDVAKLYGAEPRRILQTAIEEKVPAIMSYLSKHKWHVAKILLTDVGESTLSIGVWPGQKPHPMNIQVNQPVGISIKHGYGKFIFETEVIGLEPSADTTGGGTIVVAVPDWIEMIQRRKYFRVDVPKSLKVNLLLWHRRCVPADSGGHKESLGDSDERPGPPENYWQGRLIDISAGGLQAAVEVEQKPNFKKGQFVGLRFTPMPYETPLMFSAQVRNVLPTADGKKVCLGLQNVGLEASPEGRQTLRRLCNVVERYYQVNQSSTREESFRATDL